MVVVYGRKQIMLSIVFLVFASALGIMDAKTEIFGIEAIYWCMALMALSYLRFVYKNRSNLGELVKDSTVKWLIAFEICGAVMVAISFLLCQLLLLWGSQNIKIFLINL